MIDYKKVSYAAMKNLEKISKLKVEREEKLKKKGKLKKELEELQNEINDLEDEIAKMEGAPEEMEDIREEAENFTKDKKKRPRPSYGKDFNQEQEERTEKRQKRNEVLQENIAEGRDFKEMESEMLGNTQETEETMDNVVEEETTEKEIDELSKELEEEWNNEQIIYEESNRKRQSRKEIEDLLKELPEEELGEFDIGQGEEISLEISRMYFKVCEQEKIILIEKGKMLEIYYEFGRRFEEKLKVLSEEYQRESTAINKLINEIMEGGVNHNRRTVLRKSEKARKIYRIISVVGGKEKIKRLKVLNSEDYTKFSFKEIEEWVKNC